MLSNMSTNDFYVTALSADANKNILDADIWNERIKEAIAALGRLVKEKSFVDILESICRHL